MSINLRLRRSLAVAATLLKDDPKNIDRFIDLNLRNGADHLILFLDDPGNALPASADDPRRVTVVRMDDAWWGPERLSSLNARQRVAANAARVALARTGWADWLVFIDGDEVALLDREVLRSIPSELQAFRLLPLESVSGDDVRPDAFKRRLSKPELRDLKQAGIIDSPHNSSYFHGHAIGKTGIRPSMQVRFEVHVAVDEERNRIERFEHPSLRHVHFDSPTFSEFVRKWSALAESGPQPGLRRERPEILETFRASEHTGPADRERRQRELYERYVLDQGAELESRGLLEHIDLGVTTHQARGLRPRELDNLSHELRMISRVNKRLLLPGALRATLQEALDQAINSEVP